MFCAIIMLQKIRQKSGSLVIKIILALIGCSFVFFGVADVVRILTSTPPVAKVNRTRIQFQDFYTKYRDEKYRLMSFLGGHVPSRVLSHLPDTVLNRMIDERVIQLETKKLGLVVPQSKIFEMIQGIKAFQTDGVFDPTKYHMALKKAGLYSKTFMQDVAKELMDSQFRKSLSKAGSLNQAYTDVLVETFTNKKVFEIAFIPDNAIKIDDPSEADLQKYVTSHESLYKLPESRSAELCLIPYDRIKAGILLDQAVVEEALQERMKAQDEAIEKSKKKTFHLFTCETKEDAENVKKSFFKFSSLDEVKKQNRGVDVQEIPQEEFDKLSTDLQDSLQALSKGEAFGPIKSDDHFVVYAATDEKESDIKVLTKDEMKKAIEDDMKGTQLIPLLEDMQNKIEDAIASGTSFEEIKKTFPIETVQVQKVTQDGNDQNFPKLTSNEKTSVITTIFSLDEGADSSFSDFEEASVMVRVIKINPQHLPNLEEIKDKVVQDWKKNEQTRLENEWLRNTFHEAEDNPDQWVEIAKKAGCQIKTVTMSSFALSDKNVDPLFDHDTWDNLLLFKKNQIEYRNTQDGRTACIHVKNVEKDVAGILDEEKTEKQKQAEDSFKHALEDDVHSLLIPSVRSFYRIKIQQKVFDKVKQPDTHEE